VALLDRTEAGVRPVRLLGVSVHNLADVSGRTHEEVALPLFDSGNADDDAD